MLKQVMTSLAVLGLVSSAVAQADALFPKTAPQSTIDLCITQIAGRADYAGATLVRHEVESRERRSIGHELRIDTLVYDDEQALIREYWTTCAVGHSQRPLTFRIKEVATSN